MLRSHGYDCEAVSELNRKGLPDEQQLEFAASQERLTITHNREDFSEIASDWNKVQKSHGGLILVFRRKSESEVVGALLRILSNYDQDGRKNTIAYA